MAPRTDPDWTSRRADARRNHDAVMAAAREVFAERGSDGTIPEIAERAGVGKATVYRSHPTKDALLEAVAREQLTWFDERVRAATAADDAFAGLRALLADTSERLAGDRLLVDALAAVRARDVGRWDDAFDELVARAQQQGTMRPDATPSEIRTLVAGYARVLVDRDVRDPATWARFATLVLDAVQTR